MVMQILFSRDQDDTSGDILSSSDDNDIYNDLLEALAPMSDAEPPTDALAPAPLVDDGNIYSGDGIQFEPYPYLDSTASDFQLQISLQAGRLDCDPVSSCFILYKNNFFSVSVSSTCLNPAVDSNALSCVLYGVVVRVHNFAFGTSNIL